ILSIYHSFIEQHSTEEYAHRYVPLPLEKNSKSGWNWKGRDFARVISLLEFDRFVQEHNISAEKLLAINGSSDPELFFISHRKMLAADYDADSQRYNLHTLDLPEKDFDFVMANQTLEHVYDPVLCLRNIYDHMRPGGILYFNVPVISILHSMPFHEYTGYT